MRTSTEKDLPLPNSPSGSNTDMAMVKIAMISMTFQNWSRLGNLYGINLPDCHSRQTLYPHPDCPSLPRQASVSATPEIREGYVPKPHQATCAYQR